MHIPDGYLGPVTCIFFYIIMIPLWIYAGYKLKRTLKKRYIPYLAMGATFSFLIMMFNVPIIGGSTGHAVGGTLIALILGPWAALICVSVSLFIQALFFGDGGITSFAANCFNMAFILPFIGYGIYRIITIKSDSKSWRQYVGAGIGSYIALVVAGGLTGFELGIQTIIHPAINGHYSYFMYPLIVSIPVMLLEHLLVFGFIEGIITLLIIKYIQTADKSLLYTTRIKSQKLTLKNG